MKTLLLSLGATALLCFWLGRMSAPASSAQTDANGSGVSPDAAATPSAVPLRNDPKARASTSASRAGASSRPSEDAASATASRAEETGAANAAAGSAGASPAQDCPAQLQAVQASSESCERRRADFEGKPIAARSDVPPRFAQQGLLQTFQKSLAATRIDGRVESVDCTEHPCIVFGRLRGDEAMVAELEDAEAFSAYDADVGVMLTWASGDKAHGGEHKPGLSREKPPEVSLFAFAFYSHEDKAQQGDAIDKRIRIRTAEYWNASDVRE